VWFVLGLLNRLLLRKPLIYICHNVLPHEARWWDPCLTRVTLLWGTRFTVQSEDEKTRLLSLLPRAQAVVAPLPASNLLATQQISEEMARRQLGLPLGVPILLFFGIVREYKGLKRLLTALSEVRAQLGRVKLLVVGEFWEQKEPYLELIDQLGLADSVIIEDRYVPNEELASYFSATDVLVAPYEQVTGSAVVKMALASNCPVIATRVGSLPQAIEHGVTGLLTPAGSDQALAEAIVLFFREGLGGAPDGEAASHRLADEWGHLVTLIELLGERCR
jgi:glycosyltransferase involved in cell wall biosynthesis